MNISAFVLPIGSTIDESLKTIHMVNGWPKGIRLNPQIFFASTGCDLDDSFATYINAMNFNRSQRNRKFVQNLAKFCRNIRIGLQGV